MTRRYLTSRSATGVSPLAAAAVCAAALGFLASPLAAQLPATAPTQISQPNTLPAPIAATPSTAPVSNRPHRASVTYAAGMLDVRANDSSLNQILREIARQTGMKITGGVADERVFGNYGPAEPSTILATLLDGTGSNMLIRETASNAPAELVLTPRNGGATPPNPDAPGFDDGPADEPIAATVNSFNRATIPSPRLGPAAGRAQPAAAAQPAYTQAPTATQQMPPSATQTAPPLPVSVSGPTSIPQPLNNINGSPLNTTPSAASYPVTNSVPIDSLPTPSTTPSSSGIVDSPNPPPAGNTTAGSLTPTGNVNVPATATAGTATGGTVDNPTTPATNTVTTPEQIFQQLQALRAAHQSGAAPVPPSTAQPQ